MNAIDETQIPCPQCMRPMGRLSTSEGLRGWCCTICDTTEMQPQWRHPSGFETLTSFRRLRLPLAARGWQQALEMFVLDGRCPWCGNQMENITLLRHQLSWSCADGCNP